MNVAYVTFRLAGTQWWKCQWCSQACFIFESTHTVSLDDCFNQSVTFISTQATSALQLPQTVAVTLRPYCLCPWICTDFLPDLAAAGFLSEKKDVDFCEQGRKGWKTGVGKQYVYLRGILIMAVKTWERDTAIAREESRMYRLRLGMSSPNNQPKEKRVVMTSPLPPCCSSSLPVLPESHSSAGNMPERERLVIIRQ